MVNLIPWVRRRGEMMSPTASDVRTDIDRLFDQFIDRFFESPFGTGLVPPLSQQMQGFAPAMEISEEQNNLVIRAEIPGIDPNNIEINVNGNQLTIFGEKRDECEEKREGVYRSECRYGRFFRSVDLPQDVDADNIQADYHNGVLTLRVPRSESRQARRIAINSRGNRQEQGAQATGQKQQRGNGQSAGRQTTATESKRGA